MQSSSDVHAIAEDVAILDHDVAHVDANAVRDALVRRHNGVALGHTGLHLGCAAQRIHYAAELDQQAVTRRLDEPTVVRADLWIYQLGPDCLQRLESAALVCSDQS